MHISSGIVPLKNINNVWHVLLIQQAQGHWTFPKGHQEKGETLQETAVRELKEETKLHISKWLYPEKTFHESYTYFDQGLPQKKQVTYFLAEVSGEVIMQYPEVVGFKWLPLLEAANQLTFKEAKHLCQEISDFFLNSLR